MNFKKILASVAAAAVAVSAMSTAAFAANLTINGTFTGVVSATENWLFDLNVEGVMDGLNVADIYGATIVFTQESVDASATSGVGGAFVFSSKGNNWNQIDWGNAAAGKAITLDVETRSITRMETEPFFNETDVSGADGEYAQIGIQCWWGPASGSIEVESISLLGKDGAVLKTFGASTDTETTEDTEASEEDSSAPEETTAEETTAEETAAPEETTSEETAAPEETTAAAGDTNAPTTNDKGAADTGVEGVAVVAGLAVIAAGAVIIAKKRG